ncbi:hypothetical protein [Kitasatospora sp. NPDC085879]|uniref:hypothetical protein n=1 Tax=Kitasatospora sp. NPDC085879 TaxID=3154769 RepID=UPI00343B1A4C
MQLTGAIAQRFPLVARIRPACMPLEADAGTRRTDPGLASTVFNQAALLASDLALPDVARDLGRQHVTLYLHARSPRFARSDARQPAKETVGLVLIVMVEGVACLGHPYLSQRSPVSGLRAHSRDA